MTNYDVFKYHDDRVEKFLMDCEKASTFDNLKLLEIFSWWLSSAAKKDKPMPCPRCGGKVLVYRVESDDEMDYLLDGEECGYQCACRKSKCGYESKICDSKEYAIFTHNRAVRALKKKGVAYV